MLMGFKVEDLHICYSDLLNKDTVMTWDLRLKHSTRIQTTRTHLLVISSRCGGSWVPRDVWKLHILFLCGCGLRNTRLPGPLERPLIVCPGEQEMVAMMAELRLWLQGSWWLRYRGWDLRGCAPCAGWGLKIWFRVQTGSIIPDPIHHPCLCCLEVRLLI